MEPLGRGHIRNILYMRATVSHTEIVMPTNIVGSTVRQQRCTHGVLARGTELTECGGVEGWGRERKELKQLTGCDSASPTMAVY